MNNSEKKSEIPPCPFDLPESEVAKPAFIECLLIESFEVEYDLGIYLNDPGFPTPMNQIRLKGRPAMQGSHVVKANLYFYDDKRAMDKPLYNPETKCITASYKMSLFDQIRNMLHINPLQIHFNYYEDHTNDPNYSIHVQFYEYGKIIR